MSEPEKQRFKPLEWAQEGDSYFSQSMIGLYFIADITIAPGRAVVRMPGQPSQMTASVEEAKQVAEQDWQSRMTEALL